MRILIMGGTEFLGRAVVDCALSSGHDVTLFNRGKTNAGLYPELETIVGDRNDDLSGLHGRAFDAVIDTSAYYPRQVRAVVEALDSQFDHYTFVSTVSVYAENDTPGADESADVETVEDLTKERDEDYGGLKALCEQELESLVPGQVHYVRAGLIFGPHDHTGRFSYWPQRIAAGGKVLAPEPRSQPVQFIDVRDLGTWIVHAAEQNVVGAINASGSPDSLTLGELLDATVTSTGSDAELVWVSEDFLNEHGVKPWHDLPLWVPPALAPESIGFMRRDISRATALGLIHRPITETIAGALDNEPATVLSEDGSDEQELKEPRLSRERETELLALWQDHLASL